MVGPYPHNKTEAYRMTRLITNAMKRQFDFPPAPSVGATQAIPIPPGETAAVSDEHYEAARKGNDVLEALLAGNHIRVIDPSKGSKPPASDDINLRNPKSPETPEALKEAPKDAKVKDLNRSRSTSAPKIAKK